MNVITIIDGVESSEYMTLREARERCREAIGKGAWDAYIYRYDVKTGRTEYLECYEKDNGF